MIAPDVLSVGELLAYRAAKSPDAPFLVHEGTTTSFAEAHAKACAIAGALAVAGVEPGHMTAVMLPNGPDYVAIYFALVQSEAPVVLVNTDYRGYMLEYVLNDSASRLLVVTPDFLGAVASSLDRLESLRVVVVMGEPGAAGDELVAAGIDVRRLADLLEVADPIRAEPDDPGSLNCVVYSSGTTGPSKGVMISSGHALAKAREVLTICDFGPDDVLYSPLPLFYSMGLLRGVLSVALVGAPIVLRDRFSVSAFWDDVREHDVTVVHCVFSIPRLLATVDASDKERGHRVRVMFNAQRDAQLEGRFGVTFVESYGLTEGGNAIYNRLGESAPHGSCGRVSDEWEVKLGMPDGSEAPIGEIGEILIRPRLAHRFMLGYLNKAEATVGASRDLWFHTGDLATRDEDGWYFYKGRTKEVIRRRGQNISAWEVEMILTEFVDVVEAAALPEKSDLGEDDLRVIVVPRPGTTVDLVELASYCERRMPAFMVPRFFELRDELPKTPSGRVQKYKLVGQSPGEHTFDRGV